MSGKGRLVVIGGTRPDLLKTGPVVAELRRLGAPLTLILSGQHTTLLDDCPAVKDWGGAVNLGLQGHPDPLVYVERATYGLVEVLEEHQFRPIAAVVVQGDTGTALAGARASKALNLPLAHIEAGLRSGSLDDPWPEEGFRREISSIADWHYCPTQGNVENLASEGIVRGVHLTGNPIVSALHRYCGDLLAPPHEDRTNSLLITLHRRELIAKGHRHLCQMLDALIQFCEEQPQTNVYWPMHPSMRTAISDTLTTLTYPQNLWITEPIGYAKTISTLLTVRGVITDSGGITEEATTLGTPCVVLRQHSDRPEAPMEYLRQEPTPFGFTKALKIANWPTEAAGRGPLPVFGTPDSASKIASHLAGLT